METVILPLDPGRLDDLDALFRGYSATRGCYCMWFLARAKDVQAGWGEPNRRTFAERVRTEETPLGLLAYQGGTPVGWCAAGPRSRYVRALTSPVLKARDPAEDDSVWLVPCFYVQRDARRQGVTRLLLEHAVRLAAEAGASAIEGFPLTGEDRRRTGDAYVGVEPMFTALGFEVVACPTPSRVVVRREIVGGRA